MAKLYDLARMTVTIGGTGTLTLGAAVPPFLTFAQSGVQNGEQVGYSIIDVSGSEIGRGTYTSATTSLSRDMIYRSTGAGNTGAITVTTAAQVGILPAAEDLNFEITQYVTTGNVTVTATDQIIVINKSIAAPTSIILPAVSTFLAKALEVYDCGGNAGDMTFVPNGTDTINGLSSWVVGSMGVAGGGGSLRLTKSTRAGIVGWLAR